MLDEEDRRHLQRFERRLQMVRDRTRGVAEGWQTGFYLWGSGGIGKSWTVVDELDRLGADYKLTNSRLTAKGLFALLEESPDVVHVLEDMESLCRAQNAAGVVRSALWATKPDRRQQHQERLLTWVTGVEKREFVFTGGIILTMNLPLDDLPELRAVKTRIAHLHLQPSPPEVRALMKSIASQGYRHGTAELTPGQCLEVFDFVASKINEAGRGYDLRTMVNGFADRLQWEVGHSEHHWMDMVESRMKERVIEPATRETRIGDEREIALEIESMKVGGSEKLRLWEARTGKGKSAYYRRLRGD
jgi:hypothetical protein